MRNMNGPTWKWLVGVLVAIIFAFVSYWGASLGKSVMSLNDEHKMLSSEVAAEKARVDGTEQRLARIENKLDQLLLQVNRQNATIQSPRQ